MTNLSLFQGINVRNNCWLIIIRTTIHRPPVKDSNKTTVRIMGHRKSEVST